MAKKILDIDDDLWDATLEYVRAQVEIMRKFEALPPELKLAMEVAQYPQRLRNMRALPAAPTEEK